VVVAFTAAITKNINSIYEINSGRIYIRHMR
jgi:hypothetical protein